MTVAVTALVALSWTNWLEQGAHTRLESVLQRALVTAAIARGLNGVISVAQGTEIAVQPIGVGVTITAGEILDPLNDLVERFSWLALVASASLGIQLLLTEIATEPALNWAVSAAAVLFLAGLWWPGQRAAATWVAKGMALVLLARFLFTLVGLTVGWVDAWVLEARQTAAMAELEIAQAELEALGADTAPDSLVEPSLRERFDALLDESRQLLDLSAQLESLKARTEATIAQLLELAVLFLVQTLLVPIGALWLAIAGFRAVLRGLT